MANSGTNPGIDHLLKLLVPSKEPTETVVVNVAPASAYDPGYCASITPDLFISIGQELRANPDILKALRSMKDEQDQFESRSVEDSDQMGQYAGEAVVYA